MSTMRIAVAGTGELAQKIAYSINHDTSHHVVLLSREQRPQLCENSQVAVVDYSNPASLQFALCGIDTVVSTVTGPNQIQLIHAAVSARVRRFVPSEFEGRPSLRLPNDPLDRQRLLARLWLQHYARHIQSTTFACGIFYERFQPGGLRQSRMGLTSGFSQEGGYIMNCRTMTAEVPCFGSSHNTNVAICATAVDDVAKSVTRALDLPQWPAEMRMCGQRMLVTELVMLVQRLKGQHFSPLVWHSLDSLRSELQMAVLDQDIDRQKRVHALIATAEGRYDFTDFNVNQWVPDLQPKSFQDWFIEKWNLQRT